MLTSFNLNQVCTEIDQLTKSQDILQQHHEFMNTAFKNSHFCTIASKFKQYKVLVQSMEQLNKEARVHRELITTKAEGIQGLEEDLKVFKKGLTQEL